MALGWNIDRGRIAVGAHVESIRNGQETEPFETQATDAVTDILHALKEGWDGEGEFDADHFVAMCVGHFNCEQEDAEGED